MATAEAAPVRTAVISVPSMSASGLPVSSSKSAISAWWLGSPTASFPGKTETSFVSRIAVRVAGHRAEEPTLRHVRGGARRHGGAAGAQLDECTLERVEQKVEIEQPSNIVSREDQHG